MQNDKGEKIKWHFTNKIEVYRLKWLKMKVTNCIFILFHSKD